MPKVIKKRIPKKSLDTETDIKEKLSSFKDTIKERRKATLKYGGVFLVILIAVVLFLFYSHTSEKKARALQYEAYKIYHGAQRLEAPNRDEQYRKALETFKKAYGAKESPITLFYIAACYSELKKYDDALKTLKEFIKEYSNEERFIPLAYHKMAMVYLKKGDVNEAMKTLDSLSNLKSDIYKDLALIEYGRLLENSGRKDEAKKKYEELVKRYPDSPFIEEAKSKISDKKEG
jgi:predicted negative regulator of RcsB-dependent stress response